MDTVTTDDGFEISGGTAEEIRRELETETVDAHAHGTPKTPAAGDVDDLDEADGDAGEQTPKPSAQKAGASAPKQGKKKSPDARIGEVTKNWRTEERRRIQVERENEDLRQRLNGNGRRSGEESRAAGAEGREDARPAGDAAKFGGVPLTAEKFPSYAEMLKTSPDLELEDYTDQRQDWRSAKASAATQSEATTTAAREGFEKVASAFADRMAPHLEADPKFYDTIDPELTETPAASIFPPGHQARRQFYPFVVDLIQRSETPKELLEWLSADRSKELQRLKTLPPDQVYREILRKELSIRPDGASSGSSSEELGAESGDGAAGSRSARTSTQSAAAPPVKPVRGSSQEAVEIEATDDDSDDDWLRKETARETARRQRRR